MKFLIIALLFFCSDIIASKSINPDDLLYVWAKSGLNVRSGPGTAYDIVSKLKFGDSIAIISETNIRYNIKALTKIDTSYSKYRLEKTEPFIMYGQWKKIKTMDGTIGYTVSQYLIKLKPRETRGFLDIPIELNDIDTLFQSPIIYEGSGLNSTIKYSYTNGIERIRQNGGGWIDQTTVFPLMTFAEVLIVIGVENKYVIINRNWKDELVLSDLDGLGRIVLTKNNDKVICKVSYTSC